MVTQKPQICQLDDGKTELKIFQHTRQILKVPLSVYIHVNIRYAHFVNDMLLYYSTCIVGKLMRKKIFTDFYGSGSISKSFLQEKGCVHQGYYHIARNIGGN